MTRPRTYGKLLFVLSYFMVMLGLVEAQVIPSDEWVNFFSRNTIFHGAPISASAVIDAFDPDGVHCGTYTVTKDGQYGFLFVYRDDGLTEDVDEGATPGDTITFKINGLPVKTLGPDPCVWTGNGDILEVDLADNLSPTMVDSIKDVVMFEDDPDTIVADLDTIFFDPENDSLKFSVESNSSGIQPLIDEEHRLIISLTPDSSCHVILIVTAQDAWFTIHDTIFVQVIEINDPPVIHDLPDTSFSSDTTLTIDLNKYVEDVDHPKSSLSWEAEVQHPYQDSLSVEIDDINKLVILSAKYIFSANIEVIFTVTDDSSAFDSDTMSVQVNLPVYVEDDKYSIRPQNYCLYHNYPNPFNSTTIINYQLPKYSCVILKIFNSMGQEVAILVDEPQNSGYYSIQWNVDEQASGLYFLMMEADDFLQIRKMLLLR